ncbi:MAG: peptidoglycan DD-metalloendopeptidase family protein [Candidatus Campbellbacteria bacterium]|nr:peptidoglycan DD-metalloendopeptidase family protein [Candidatus Campbellbacteria bacterium]
MGALKLISNIYFIFIVGIFLLVSFSVSNVNYILAQENENEEELRNSIDDKNNQIREIEKEIEKYKKELEETGAEKKTLTNKLRQLESTKNKIGADIKRLQVGIQKSNLEIKRLTLRVEERERKIKETKSLLAKLYRAANEQEMNGHYEFLFASNEDITILSASRYIYDTRRIEGTLHERIDVFQLENNELKETKQKRAEEKNVLQRSQGELVDKRTILNGNIRENSNLIAQTRNEEKKYQELLTDRENKRRELELEILDFEGRLQFILDPKSIPKAGAILSWPIVSPRLTQGFGCTSFARRNKHIYGGKCFHPGIDIGASVGTKLLAPLEGIVRATGNTDSKRGCYSFGKWIAIDHPNGLSTIYAHLSIIKVKEGDKVRRGELIGYTGNTGVSTGPHLDFRVYASKGLKVVRFEQISPSTSCRGISVPTAANTAKLNPLDYLPS